MLSICIPTYNYDVSELVMALNNQVATCKLDCEILIADDSSSNIELKEKSKLTAQKYNAAFFSLDKNIGRAAIRNFLVSKAKGDSILFLDSDTFPVGIDFLQKYFRAINEDVVVGGIAYREELSDINEALRWVYGNKRESKTADNRSGRPYSSFMTGNFMIKKDVFRKILFDESIVQYGHEDTLFGIQLKENNYSVKHIDNPVYHDGLESNDVFISKTKKGIENLLNLYTTSEYKTELQSHIKLLHTFVALHKVGLDSVFAWIFRRTQKWFLKQLNKKEPNLKIFDFFKLGYMCEFSLRN